jgi:putative oxidoreductase
MSHGARWGVTLIRVVTGVVYVMHGYLAFAVLGPAAVAGYTRAMGFPEAAGPLLAWYLVVAHGLGGLALVLGVATRWAALVQVPIILSALLLHHLRQGFFMTGIVVDAARGQAVAGGYEYTLLLLAVTVALVLLGGGALSSDGRR